MRRCSFVRCVALSPSYPSGGWCLLGAGRGRWAMALPGRSGWTGWAVVSSRASIGEMVDGVGEDTAECKKAACGGDIRWALLLGGISLPTSPPLHPPSQPHQPPQQTPSRTPINNHVPRMDPRLAMQPRRHPPRSPHPVPLHPRQTQPRRPRRLRPELQPGGARHADARRVRVHRGREDPAGGMVQTVSGGEEARSQGF
ncbi:hypothetical protein IWX46DRAFT_616893 [Phyllosticta citricarpa]|uniref:Uncharacterized protein n=1 Tax=Phyllosticta citricarpa TaxID=55181 RepID=A0ABR1L484_9PEZI